MTTKEAQPVAWRVSFDGKSWTVYEYDPAKAVGMALALVQPLYTHPQPSLSARMKEMESVAFEDWLSDRYPTGNVEEIQLQWLQSSEHDDMINEFEELQRLTEAGEIQAALERIAELEAALRVAERATWSASEHAALYFGVTHNIAMGCHDANLVARAALAGEAKARPAQDDGGYDLLAAWDASKFSAGFFVVHPMYQAGWDAAKAAPKLTEAEILDIRAQSYIGNYGPRPYLDELAFARAIEAKVRSTP